MKRVVTQTWWVLPLVILIVLTSATLERLNAVPADGQLLGTDGNGGHLIAINTTTGVGTQIGSVGIGSVPSLAVDPTTGTLYAGKGGGQPFLYRVNPVTAAATLVGDTGLGLASIGGMDFTAAGVLYASVNITGDGTTGSDHLAILNKATGVATVIGSFGTCTSVSCTIDGIEGIAFDASGQLWGTHTQRGPHGTPGLYRINTGTGAATFVGSYLGASSSPLGPIPPPSGGIVSLHFACDGRLFGGTARGLSGADGGRLATIDLTTRAVSYVGSSSATGGSSLASLAFTTNCGASVSNLPSQSGIVIDGLFTGGVNTTTSHDASGNTILHRVLVGEWSDIVPLGFVSQLNKAAPLLRVPLSDPRVNSLLYVGLAPDETTAKLEDVYLMYDYLPRTDCHFAPRDFIADVKFPVVLNGTSTNITVQVRGSVAGVGQAVRNCDGNSFFDVFVDLNGDGIADRRAGDLHIDGAVGFGPSTLSLTPHLLVELEVPLLIPPNFGVAFPPEGQPTGVYSPAPAFWSGSFPNNFVDPEGSEAMFMISGNGSTTAVSTMVQPAPTNVPPSIMCPAPIIKTAVGGSASVQIVVHFEDPDGDPLSVIWKVDNVQVQTDSLAAGGPPTQVDLPFTRTYAVGGHTINASVTDNKAAPVNCDAMVTVSSIGPADVNSDGVISCTDVAIVKAAFGKRSGQPGFDSRADVNADGVIDVRDLAAVTSKLPAGTRCS